MSAASAERPVVVTGGAGFIGSCIADRLAAQGRRVLVLDAMLRKGSQARLKWLERRWPHGVEAVKADVRDHGAVRQAVRGAGAVLHLAGQVAVTTSLEDPAEDFAVNAGGALAVLEAARLARPEPIPVVFASTNKVYGGLKRVELIRGHDGWRPVHDAVARHGVDETEPLRFATPYGCSKGAADQHALGYAASFGAPTVVMRMSCVYGPRQYGDEDQGWVAHFAAKALRGEEITVFGDGRQVRDLLYVEDCATAWLAALARIDRSARRAFNLGGGPANAVSLTRLIEALQTALGRPVRTRHAEWRPGDQRWYVSDTRAITRALDLAAPRGWRDGLDDLLDWMRERSGQNGLDR